MQLDLVCADFDDSVSGIHRCAEAEAEAGRGGKVYLGRLQADSTVRISFLNKIDVFREKIILSPISRYYPGKV